MNFKHKELQYIFQYSFISTRYIFEYILHSAVKLPNRTKLVCVSVIYFKVSGHKKKPNNNFKNITIYNNKFFLLIEPKVMWVFFVSDFQSLNDIHPKIFYSKIVTNIL